MDTADLREKAQRRVLLMTALVVAHDLVGFVPARLDSHAESMVLGDIVLIVANVITEQNFTIGIHHLIHACSALISVLITIVEVQLRTIAMDFWASLDHKLSYKKDIPEEEAKLLRQELLECAQISADLDVRMGEIKNRIVNKENT